MSGLNAVSIGKLYDEFFTGYKYFIETDFTGFDSSQGKIHYDLEQEVYAKCLPEFIERSPHLSDDDIRMLAKSIKNQN